jgi:hypothetical protein
MPRDLHIRRAFEVADDAMQAAIGYFMYGIACEQKAELQEVLSALPPAHIPITHNWVRNYSPSELCHAMERLFEPYHARVALIAVIGAFEGALRNFGERLVASGKIAKPPGWNYKRKLEWAFSIARQAAYGDQQMQARIPTLCLHVDHARRIRNLWMHNNGLFDSEYAEGGIQIPGQQPIIDAVYVEQVQKKRRRKVGVVLSSMGFFQFAKSHIELLHHLHDTIQRIHFRQKRSYGYRQLKKRIEWHRLLTGESRLSVISNPNRNVNPATHKAGAG